MYAIPDNLARQLVVAPESGMGYQLVQAGRQTDSGEGLRYFAILNSQWALETDPDWQPVDGDDISPYDYAFRYWRRMGLLDRQVEFHDSAAGAGSFPYSMDELRVHTHGSFAAQSHDEVFYRYSAFANDRRLQQSGFVPAGTYFTSHGDTRFAVSGLGAVARYALPNPAPAIFCRAIGIPHGAALMCGTTSPKFGQSGGGVEIRLDRGVQGARIYDPEILPVW